MGAQGTVDFALIQVFKIRKHSGVVGLDGVHLIRTAAVCDNEDITRPLRSVGFRQVDHLLDGFPAPTHFGHAHQLAAIAEGDNGLHIE